MNFQRDSSIPVTLPVVSLSAVHFLFQEVEVHTGSVSSYLYCSLQGAVTIAVRYGATRQQFGPANAPEIAVLDYSSQQEKLMPMLSNAYAFHFTSRYLVDQYAEAKRTKEEDVIADVHALSAGAGIINLCIDLTIFRGINPKVCFVQMAGIFSLLHHEDPMEFTS